MENTRVKAMCIYTKCEALPEQTSSRLTMNMRHLQNTSWTLAAYPTSVQSQCLVCVDQEHVRTCTPCWGLIWPIYFLSSKGHSVPDVPGRVLFTCDPRSIYPGSQSTNDRTELEAG